MNFELNEDTRAILETARRFVEQEVTPRLKEEGFKRDLVSRMGELGFKLLACREKMVNR